MVVQKQGVQKNQVSSKRRAKRQLKNDMYSGKVLLVAQEISFARVLAGNDPVLRQRGVKRLRKWLSARSKNLEENDFSIIWKGLYYCMWMADKPLFQEELAETISSLVHCFEDLGPAVKFIKIFFSTMAAEWRGIDQHRIGKFLMLVRRFLRQCLIFLDQREWDLDAVKKVSRALMQTVLPNKFVRAKVSPPVGFVLHFTDIFLEELAKVSKGDLEENVFLSLLNPFTLAMGHEYSSGFRSCIHQNIFMKLLRITPAGIEFEEKFAAWSELGFPGGTIDVMQGGGDDASGSEADSSEENNADHDDKEEEGNVDEDNGMDYEDDEIIQNAVAGGTVWDPRAGGVDVDLPLLNFNPISVAVQLRKCRNQKFVSVKTRLFLNKLIKKFEDVASGVYPLGVKEVPTINGDEKIMHEDIHSALKRLRKLENRLSISKDKIQDTDSECSDSEGNGGEIDEEGSEEENVEGGEVDTEGSEDEDTADDNTEGSDDENAKDGEVDDTEDSKDEDTEDGNTEGSDDEEAEESEVDDPEGSEDDNAEESEVDDTEGREDDNAEGNEDESLEESDGDVDHTCFQEPLKKLKNKRKGNTVLISKMQRKRKGGSSDNFIKEDTTTESPKKFRKGLKTMACAKVSDLNDQSKYHLTKNENKFNDNSFGNAGQLQDKLKGDLYAEVSQTTKNMSNKKVLSKEAKVNTVIELDSKKECSLGSLGGSRVGGTKKQQGTPLKRQEKAPEVSSSFKVDNEVGNLSHIQIASPDTFKGSNPSKAVFPTSTPKSCKASQSHTRTLLQHLAPHVVGPKNLKRRASCDAMLQADKNSSCTESANSSPKSNRKKKRNSLGANELLQEGEYEIFIPKKRPIIKQLSSTNHSLSAPNSPKSKLVDFSSPISGIRTLAPVSSSKKVNFVPGRNKAQSENQYFKTLQANPEIPYDAAKKPERSVLKPSPYSSPVNPFYKFVT